MLLLVTILLVVVGTISLVIGYAQSSLLPIYVSIACSVLAAGVLLIFSRMTAKSQKVDTAGGPAPLDYGRPEPARTEPIPALAGSRYSTSGSETFAPEPEDEGPGYAGALAVDDEDVREDDFPIERYDSRRVGEILPLLAELDVDELDIVREHEERGKGRATVLARIDQLIDQLEAEDRQEAEHRFDAEDDLDAAPPVEVAPEPPAPAPAPSSTVSVAALPDDDDYFPIEDYDDLRASEILPLLPELDDDELGMVRARERSGSARSSILHRIEALLESSPTAAGPLAAPPAPEAVVVEPEPEPEPPPAPEPEPEPSPVLEPEPEPEPVLSEVPPAPPAKRPRATRPAKAAGAGRAAKVSVSPPAAAAAAAAKAPSRTSKAAPKTAATKVTKAVKAPAKAAKSAKAPLGKAAEKVAKVAKAPAKATVKAPAKQAPATAPRKAAPVKRAQKGTAGASSTLASKATKRASKR